MKNLYTVLFCFLAIGIQAQTIWDAAPITFEKESMADWTLEENQDRITDNVWITRTNNRSIFNIVLEEEHDNEFYESPFDTEWAFGTTADLDNLTFTFFDITIMSFPPDMVDVPMVMHLITDDIYIDITFTFWQEGGGGGGNGGGNGGGGGFAYTRASQPTLSVGEIEKQKISIYPNPASNFLKIGGVTQNTRYTITSLSGQILKKGVLTTASSLNISDLASGIYVLSLEENSFYKFVKI